MIRSSAQSTGRGRRAIATLAAAVMVLSACGSDSKSESTSTTAAAAATTAAAASDTTEAATATSPAASDTTAAATDTKPAPTGDPVKVGLLIALTGSKAEASKNVVKIAQGWVKMTNENGGVAGHPLELIVKDSKADPATAQAAASELVEQDKIVGLFLNDSQAEGSLKDYLVAKNVPVIGADGYNTEEWAKLPNFFSYWLDIPGTIYASPYAAATLGAKTFAAFSCAEVAACAQAEAIYKPAAEGLGMTWAGLQTIAGAAPDYTAECLTLVEKNVDFVILSVVSSVAVRVVQDCLQQGYKGYFGSTAGGFEQYLFHTVPGAKIAGALHGFPWWVDAAPVQKYRDFLAKYAPDAEYRSPVMSNMYAGLELFAKAMQNATGAVTSQTVFDGYYGLKNETLDGLLPQPFNAVAGQPVAKGVCYWPYTYDTTTDDIKLMATSGDSGNGATDSLQSSCVTELKK